MSVRVELLPKKKSRKNKMPKLFQIKADGTFYAENIDDAFVKLVEHFLDPMDSPRIFESGGIEIRPVKVSETA